MGSGASAAKDLAAELPDEAKELLLVEPGGKAPLDEGFRPVILARRKYRDAAKDCADTIHFALPRPDGCARGSMKVFPDDDKRFQASVATVGIVIQETVWRCGATALQLCGPQKICESLQAAWSPGGAFEFEAATMPKCFGTPDSPFPVTVVDSPDKLPEAKDTPQECGKEANGCRLAFDLGKSDIKTVAINDGEVLDSMETEWDVTNVDPQYHFDAIVAAMKGTITRAKEKGFGDIQAVGGSATGTVSGNNEATWCDIFQRMAKEVAGDVPLKVINDGEVTALAAVQKI